MNLAQYQLAFAPATHIVPLGRLVLPSGRIAACDPFFCSGALPFKRKALAGTYDVDLRLVTAGPAGLRVACARILFSPQSTAAAVERAETYSPSRAGFFVDSGLGCLMDAEAISALDEAFARFYAHHPQGNYYDDIIAAELKAQSVPPCEPGSDGSWAMYAIPGSDLNAAICASGLGDGSYDCFWVLDEMGAPAALVADFQLSDHL